MSDKGCGLRERSVDLCEAFVCETQTNFLPRDVAWNFGHGGISSEFAPLSSVDLRPGSARAVHTYWKANR